MSFNAHRTGCHIPGDEPLLKTLFSYYGVPGPTGLQRVSEKSWNEGGIQVLTSCGSPDQYFFLSVSQFPYWYMERDELTESDDPYMWEDGTF